MADPALDAYLQALGFNQQSDLANSQAAQQRGQVQATYDMAVPQLQYQTGLQQRSTTSDALGRGVYDSGEYQRNLADVNTQAAQKQAQLDLSRDQGLEDVGMSLAKQLAGIDIGRNTATYNWNQWNTAQQQQGTDQTALGNYLQTVLNQQQAGGFQSQPPDPYGGLYSNQPGVPR